MCTPSMCSRKASPKVLEVDVAILEALSNPGEKKTVGELEELVIRFIGDDQRDLLEFNPGLGTYQVASSAK